MVSDLARWTFRGNRSTSGRKPQIKGYRLTKSKDGKVTIVKNIKHLDVSAQLRMRASKKVRVVPRGKT
jgi:hypothetical protein